MAQGSRVDAQARQPGKIDQRSDLEIIAEINNGDADAFEVLYLRYRDWVVAQAYRHTGDSDSALDVMQETFLYVLRKFPGFKLTANFKTFLYPAVRNLSIGARRKAARYQSTEGERAELEQAVAPGANRAGRDHLNPVLGGLSEEHREVLLLRFVDGLSLAEVAEAIEIPVGTVKSRLHNALETLRNDPRTRELFEE